MAHNLFAECEKANLNKKQEKELTVARRLLHVLAHEVLKDDYNPLPIGRRPIGYEEASDDLIIKIGAKILTENKEASV